MMKPLSVEEAASFHVMGLLTARDLVEVAVRALVEERESESLSILAGETNPDMFVVGPLFERCLKELSIEKQRHVEARLSVVHNYARDICEGGLSPYDGAKAIWPLVSDFLDSSSYLMRSFIGFASNIEDIEDWTEAQRKEWNSATYLKEMEDGILQAAEDVLKLKTGDDLLENASK